MAKLRKLLIATVFLTVCALVIILLLQFTQIPSISQYIDFDTIQILSPDGSIRDVDLTESYEVPKLGDGEYFRFEGTVKNFPDDGYFEFFVSNAEMILLANGVKFFQLTSIGSNTEHSPNEERLKLPDGIDREGIRLTVLMRPLEGDMDMFPPLMMVVSANEVTAMNESIDYHNAIPAGIYGVVFIIVCGLFALSIYLRKMYWPLLVLTAAAGVLFVRQLAQMDPFSFLPKWIANVMKWEHLNVIVPMLLIAYLALSGKEVWRWLWRLAMWTGAALLAAYGVSKFQGTVFAANADSVIEYAIKYHYYHSAINWFNTYMVILCGVIAAMMLVKTVLNTVTENRTLELKNRYIIDNYRAIEQNYNDTASLRHDWKNKLTALNLLYQQNDMERLGELLREMDDGVGRLSMPVYSDCFIVNALLQNASVRAARSNVRFQAQAPLPEKLAVDEADLCSFLMNLLDNAFDAAEKVEDIGRRFVAITLKINQGFLAVSCRNSFSGHVEKDEEGRLITTKESPDGHGLGLKQMEMIARKYGSKLDLIHDGDVFTVQTALKLKNEQ